MVTPRLRHAANLGAIADRIDGEAENVEANGHIADRSRRKRRALAARPPRAADVSHTRSEIGCQPQQIGEHAAGCHLRTCTGTLNDQRVVAVARGGKAHDIVGQRDVGERMAGDRVRSGPPSLRPSEVTAPT